MLLLPQVTRGYVPLVLFLGVLSLITFTLVDSCPGKCTCSGLNVDCNGQELKAVPKGIPRNAERLDLDKNNITRITKTDFVGLKNLRVLHLEDNQISIMEHGAFQDLKQLERMRLNRNKLQVLPELLFQNTVKLIRLGYTSKDTSWCNNIVVIYNVGPWKGRSDDSDTSTSKAGCSLLPYISLPLTGGFVIDIINVINFPCQWFQCYG